MATPYVADFDLRGFGKGNLCCRDGFQSRDVRRLARRKTEHIVETSFDPHLYAVSYSDWRTHHFRILGKASLRLCSVGRSIHPRNRKTAIFVCPSPEVCMYQVRGSSPSSTQTEVRRARRGLLSVSQVTSTSAPRFRSFDNSLLAVPRTMQIGRVASGCLMID